MKVKCCFLIDATASMARWISAAKRQTRKIREEILSENPDITLEIGAVFYRDLHDNERFVTVPFTQDITEFEDGIRNVWAEGGDDDCEDVAGGFQEVLRMPWADADLNHLFLICDAPPHGRDWHMPDVTDDYPDDEFDLPGLVRSVAHRDIRLTIIKATEMLNPMIIRMDDIFRNAGRYITVANLVPQAVPLRTRHVLTMDPTEELTLRRTVSREVSSSIRGGDYSQE